MGEAREYPIQPTAPQATEQYSDIALAGLFNAHTAMIDPNSALTDKKATHPLRRVAFYLPTDTFLSLARF